MKIKINEFGLLEFKRKNKWKTAECPYSTDKFCGDWCVFFGEPVKFFYAIPNSKLKSNFVNLEICNKFFVIKKEDFTDERRTK